MMTPDTIPHHNVRYYQVPPKEKTVAQCAGHGYDHGSYKWSKQIDPRWSQEQIDAYLTAYSAWR